MSAKKWMTTKDLGRALLCVVAFLSVCDTLHAHKGPPYPVIVDQPVAEYLVSVWADPDLGTGSTFYIMTDPSDEQETVSEPDVEVWVQPTTHRLPKVSYEAEREAIPSRIQFAAHPEFDALEMWEIGVRVTPPGKQAVELTTEVEVTPPGLGKWDLLMYLFPFAFIGGMWALALRRRWKAHNSGPTSGHSPTSNAGESA
jgi:hypothetical protein